MKYKRTRVLVCGMARSGQAAARLLAAHGATVTVQDNKPDIVWAGEKPLKLTEWYGVQPDAAMVCKFHLIVVSPGVPYDTPFLTEARAMGIPVWGEMELAYLHCTQPIVAITGTNGKTTVCTLTGAILRAHNGGTEVLGNIGIPFSDRAEHLTDVVVAETSSFQLESISRFKPWISAVLNLQPDHLDRHETMENYGLTKARIFENQAEGDFCVLNFDNAYTREMYPACTLIHFSTQKAPLKNGVFLQDGRIKANFLGRDLDLMPIADTRVLPENALAVTALCLCAGVPEDLIAHHLRTFHGVEHRIEFVRSLDGIEYYNDSKATNTDAALKGLEAMSRPVVLIAGGYDKKTAFDDWVAQFSGKVKKVFLLGETAGQIADTCKAHGFTAFETADSLASAVSSARAAAEDGDAVLLSPACASWGMFKDFEERGNLFKQYVNALT